MLHKGKLIKLIESNDCNGFVSEQLDAAVVAGPAAVAHVWAELLKMVTAGLKPSYQRALAFLLPDCPPGALAKGAGSALWVERCAVAQHPAVSAKIVARLAQDPHPVVRAAAQARLGTGAA